MKKTLYQEIKKRMALPLWPAHLEGY